MVITEDYEIDKFFLSKINLQDRRQLHLLSLQITNEYIECLSEYLDLDVRDTHHLAKEMTYHSVCIFLDTAYRINNANPKQVITGNNFKIFSTCLSNEPKGYTGRTRFHIFFHCVFATTSSDWYNISKKLTVFFSAAFLLR
mgnify:CR=1 FL=1